MEKIIFGFPNSMHIAKKIADKLDLELGKLTMKKFPDSETFIKIYSEVKDKDVILVCSLNNPDLKLLPILFFVETVKSLGAKSVGLVAPYLPYMRQDKRFSEGEAITSKYFAELLSKYISWLITIDPHLHRYKSLSEIYSIPTHTLHAAKVISEWIKHHITNPVIVGPDEESEQWVSKVAEAADAPFFVLKKQRHSNGSVEISLPPAETYKLNTPVLIDDIISTANTMIETVRQLKDAGMHPPICIGTHGIFAEHAYDHLLFTGIAKLATCNTIEHVSNEIDVSGLIVEVIAGMK
jgi:ribose-phosphate pyrophosphokinase